MEQKKTILVVDDVPEIRQLLKTRLEIHDFFVVEAVNGSEGITRANSYLPDLIITDFSMPEKNGMELAREMRQSEKTNDIPIILLSSFPFGKIMIEEMKSIGITEYMMKPYEFDILFEKIHELINHNEKRSDKIESMDAYPGLKDYIKEKRLFPRFDTFSFAQVKINGETYLSQITNISGNGLKITLPENAPIGSELTIFFQENTCQYRGQAKVVWVNENLNESNYTAGLEIEKVEC